MGRTTRGLVHQVVRSGVALAACLGVSAFAPVALGDSPDGEKQPTKFSESAGALPQGWRPHVFPKVERHTEYRLVRESDEAAWIVEATSSASASGLIHSTAIDLRERPILRWRWKVAGVLEAGNARRKDGDDYPARIYLIFAEEESGLTFWQRVSLRLVRKIYGDMPSRAINYIWASHLEKGAVVDSAFVGGFVKLVAVESGAEQAGSWHVEERDVFADYKTLFGTEPPLVAAVAIMTDTDDTRERARAWYGDIEFLAREVADKNFEPRFRKNVR